MAPSGKTNDFFPGRENARIGRQLITQVVAQGFDPRSKTMQGVPVYVPSQAMGVVE
jgi:hypothetical protein